MKRVFLIMAKGVALCFLATALFASCAVIKDKGVAGQAPRAFGVARTSNALNMKNLAMTGNAMMDTAASINEEGAVNSGTNTQPKKLIKNGSVTVQVEDLSQTEKAVNEWVKGFGGYILQSGTYETSSNYTAKIPADKFDEAMKSVTAFGILKERSQNVSDVTEQYYDLKTRLNNKRVMKEKLEKYLTQAKDVKDMLQIEVELNNTITDIENMEGRMKRLTGEIDYSTININAVLPYGKRDTKVTSAPKFAEAARRFVVNALSFFPKCFVVLLYIIICGIPVLACLGFLYWLLWGHVGLLKKLYRWLSK